MQYQQEKYVQKNKLNSICTLDLNIYPDRIEYKGAFYMEFKRWTVPYGVTFIHEIILNKKNGDFNIRYQIINEKFNDAPYKNKLCKRKNNFERLQTLVRHGFYLGEKNKGYWGKKYEIAVRLFFNQIKDDLQKQFTDTYFSNKLYDFKDLFELIVDFHLYKKNIKAHNNVYNIIEDIYPKKNWLKSNNNKFLPAILDEHGIKSKYLIKILSSPTKNNIKNINIQTLIFVCNLFGENYIDYIKQFNWIELSNTFFRQPKKFVCKNESEKKIILRIFKAQDKEEPVRVFTTLEYIYQLFNTREFLEKNGYENLKLDLKKPEDIGYLLDYWVLLKKQITTGFIEKYIFPSDILHEIESPIIVGDKTFLPKILSSSEDFCIEGKRMKNCMSRQFGLGIIQIFMSLSYEKKRVDLQYQRGKLNMAYGKANTPVPKEIFGKAIEILTSRMLKYKDVKWEKKKYNIIQNE